MISNKIKKIFNEFSHQKQGIIGFFQIYLMDVDSREKFHLVGSIIKPKRQARSQKEGWALGAVVDLPARIYRL